MNRFLLFFLLFPPSVIICQNVDNDTINQVDEKGRKQGFWIKRDDAGSKIHEGRFNDDYPTGKFTYFYKKGEIRNISYFSNKGQNAKMTSYFPDGKPMAEGVYVNKQKDGLWKYFNKDSVLISEEYYKNNKKNGIWKTYYPGGTLSDEVTWKEGVKSGPWKQYYTDMKLKLKATYVDDYLEGLSQMYHLNGVVNVSGNYKSSVKEGVWMYFKEDRTTEKRRIYHNGVIKKEEVFLHSNKALKIIDIETIAYICYRNGKMSLVKKNDEKIYIDEKMNDLEIVLDYTKFVKINKLFIAGYSSIKNISNYSGERIKFEFDPAYEFEVIGPKELREIFKFHIK